MKRIRALFYFYIAGVCLTLTACGIKEQPLEVSSQNTLDATVSESIAEDNSEEDSVTDIHIPSKEEVLAMRELVLEGMSDEEKERLTENVKIANLRMESAYLNDRLFDRLSDKENLYWNYFDQKGEIQ